MPQEIDGNGYVDMATKQPTNADILKEVREMNGRLIALENWKISEDAYRAALARVKDDEKEAKINAQGEAYTKRRSEIMKQAGIVLGLVAAILYAYAATKGIAITP